MNHETARVGVHIRSANATPISERKDVKEALFTP